MRKIIFILIVLLSCAPSFAEGLDNLIEAGRNMSDIGRAMDAETKTFENVKRAIKNGTLKIGESKDSIRTRYGEPVIELEKEANAPGKWVYMPASSTFFKGIRIYLIFDDNG